MSTLEEKYGTKTDAAREFAGTEADIEGYEDASWDNHRGRMHLSASSGGFGSVCCDGLVDFSLWVVKYIRPQLNLMQCLRTIHGVRCGNPTESHLLYCERHAREEPEEPPKKTTAVKLTYEELEAKVDELTKAILNR